MSGVDRAVNKPSKYPENALLNLKTRNFAVTPIELWIEA